MLNILCYTCFESQIPIFNIRFIKSENSSQDAAYFAALAADKDLGQTRGIDATLEKFNLDAILLPTNGFTAGPAAIAGYPVVTGQAYSPLFSFLKINIISSSPWLPA